MEEQGARFRENEFVKILPFFFASYPSPNTRQTYQKAIEEFFNHWHLKGIPLFQLKELQRFHLETWQRTLESSGRYTPSSICAKMSALVSLCRFLVENEWIEKNPAAFVKLPRVSKLKGKTQALSQNEIVFLLEKLQGNYLNSPHPSYKKEHYDAWLTYGIFLTLATIGMRCSELVQLKISDFKQTGVFYRLHLRLKGGEDHAPLIPHYLSEFILSYLKNCRSFSQEHHPLFSLEKSQNEPIGREYLSKLITKTGEKHGLQTKISAHSLRATVASLLHKNNVPVGEIQDLLGHKSILTTMMYVRKTDEENESAALKNPLGKILETSR